MDSPHDFEFLSRGNQARQLSPEVEDRWHKMRQVFRLKRLFPGLLRRGRQQEFVERYFYDYVTNLGGRFFKRGEDWAKTAILNRLVNSFNASARDASDEETAQAMEDVYQWRLTNEENIDAALDREGLPRHQYVGMQPPLPHRPPFPYPQGMEGAVGDPDPLFANGQEFYAGPVVGQLEAHGQHMPNVGGMYPNYVGGLAVDHMEGELAAGGLDSAPPYLPDNLDTKDPWEARAFHQLDWNVKDGDMDCCSVEDILEFDLQILMEGH